MTSVIFLNWILIFMFIIWGLMEQRKCFSLQCLSPSLPWSTLRTRKNSIAKEKHLALGVSRFVSAPRAWRQLRKLIKINGEKELNKSQHEYLWKSILQRSSMEVKKRCPVLPLILGRGRLNLSQCALDRSLSVDLSHSLSLSISLTLCLPLSPSLLSPSRKRRKRPSRSQGYGWPSLLKEVTRTPNHYSM